MTTEIEFQCEMFAGDYKEIGIEVPDSSTGQLVNLTGAAVQWGLKEYIPNDRYWEDEKYIYKGPNLVYKNYPDGGINIPDPASGVFVVIMNPEDTVDLAKDEANYYHYGAKVIDSTGKVSTVISGVIKINPSVV